MKPRRELIVRVTTSGNDGDTLAELLESFVDAFESHNGAWTDFQILLADGKPLLEHKDLPTTIGSFTKRQIVTLGNEHSSSRITDESRRFAEAFQMAMLLYQPNKEHS